MAAHKRGKPAPRHAANGSLKVQGLAACTSNHKPTASPSQALLPSRAALARRWPRLRVNRLSWRWRDDATGARGDSIETLVVFLGERAR